MGPGGLDPPTSRLWVGRSNQAELRARGPSLARRKEESPGTRLGALGGRVWVLSGARRRGGGWCLTLAGVFGCLTGSRLAGLVRRILIRTVAAGSTRQR